MIRFEGKAYDSKDNETVLDCLERNGVSVPCSCRSGICQACLMRATDGKPPSSAQKGLKPSLVSQNYFMSCSCVASQDLEISFPASTTGLVFSSKVLNKCKLSDEIVRVRLQRPDNYEYFSGQYLTLYKKKGLGRNYSIASVPDRDGFLELHIRRVPGGAVSNWAHDQLHEGDEISIGHAIGNCFYVAGHPTQPLLLIGTGCGLAPLAGILQAALLQGHQGDVKLYHGSRSVQGLYLSDSLEGVRQQYPNFSYSQCLSAKKHDTQTSFRHGRATDLALQDNPDLTGWRVFICGTTDMVKATKKAVFLTGASMQDIYCDEFVQTKFC